jgi:hypothetical protein
MASTTCWLHYYQAKAVLEDNNPIALLAVTPIELSVSVTKSHLDKPDRFRSTIGAKEIATMITVPKAEQQVYILHHGALFARGLGKKPLAIFVAGNRISAPIKIFDIDEAS